MTRCVVIATMQRGRLDPPELLDEANSWRVRYGAALDEQQCLRGARLNWARERDGQVSEAEADALRRPVESDLEALENSARVQRMLRLAMGRVS